MAALLTAFFGGFQSSATCGEKSRWNFRTGQVSSKLKNLKDRFYQFILLLFFLLVETGFLCTTALAVLELSM